MNGNSPDASITDRHTVILELVGPAGAGKTTIRKMLLHRFAQAKLLNYPFFRELKALPFFVLNTIKMAPLLARVLLYNRGRQVKLQELVLMVILSGWPPILKRQAAEHDGFVILDQGPVYILAMLDTMGPPRLHAPFASAWMNKEYNVWAHTVKIIIYLDTNDSILVERINTRGKWHGVVGKPVHEAQEFLIRSRNSLNHAICGLAEQNANMRVYRFNTNEMSAEEISDEVINIVNNSL